MALQSSKISEAAKTFNVGDIVKITYTDFLDSIGGTTIFDEEFEIIKKHPHIFMAKNKKRMMAFSYISLYIGEIAVKTREA